MPNIKDFDVGNLGLRPSEVGVDAQAGTARRVGMYSNQQAGAVEQLAAETERLASQTQGLGRGTQGLGNQTEALGRQKQQLGRETQSFGRETQSFGRETQSFGQETRQLGREQQQLGSETEREGSIKGQALDDTGRRLGSAVTVAGDAAVKYLDHQQISHGAQTFASLTEQATNDWNETVKTADPNDPTVGKKFMDGLNGRLDNFKGDGFYTENAQQWAQAHTDALRQHFAEKTSADMSTLAGQAARVNTAQTINSLSNTVHSDPSSLDFSIAALKSTTEGMISSSPNLTGTQANGVRSEIVQKGTEAIVKSAAVGYIEKTGQMPPWAKDPKYAPYINGAELKQFEKAAQVQAKSFDLASKQARIAQQQLDDQAVHAGANKIMGDNVSIDPNNGRPVINPKFFQDALDLAKRYPNAPSASTTVRTILDWGEHQQNQKAAAVVSDAGTKQDLTDRMFSADNPTTRIDLMKAQVAGKLSNQDFTSMERLVTEMEQGPLRGPVYKDAMDAAKNQLILKLPIAGAKDDAGVQNYSKFVQTFVPQYLAASRAGTLQPNALDTSDPKSMISQSMAPFKRTPMQAIQDHITAMGGVGSPPRPKEGGQDIPAPLRGIAALQYNAAKGLWRDQTSGKVYDKAGAEVK